MRAEGDVAVAMRRHPRCPFASSEPLPIRSCPGYTASGVAGGPALEGSDGSSFETCTHLSSERDRRGFYPACHHPDAPLVVARVTISLGLVGDPIVAARTAD